jgi:hypothetical protein
MVHRRFQIFKHEEFTALSLGANEVYHMWRMRYRRMPTDHELNPKNKRVEKLNNDVEKRFKLVPTVAL